MIAGVSTNNSTGCMIIPVGSSEHRRGNGGRGIFAGWNDSNSSIKNIDFINNCINGKCNCIWRDYLGRKMVLATNSS